MNAPHGGKLIERIVDEKRKRAILGSEEKYFKLSIDEETMKDVENIAYGTFSPLTGFMTSEELRGVMEDMRLPSDVPWTIPILLDVPEDTAAQVKEGETIMLTDEEGKAFALMDLKEKYTVDRGELSEKVFGTTDPDHPGVVKINEMKEILLGGDIELIQSLNTSFETYNLRPRETRVLFNTMGWKTVAAFQTRNAPHNGHEYVQKAALTFMDGLFVNPVIGKKKSGDFTDEMILETYDELIEHYYPENKVVMSILPFEMRYAGPREAIFHAIIRKNYGCTHIIIGRDHAGVGDFYGPFDAHKIFDNFPDLGIEPLFFRSFFYCKKCGGVANDNICPHVGEHIINFAGTKMRKLLSRGERPDDLMMRPEVVDVILKSDRPFVE